MALDRSGSMQGKKIEQVRAAAVQVLEGLNDGEFFNIITYNDKVQSFAEKPLQKILRDFCKRRRNLSKRSNPAGARI